MYVCESHMCPPCEWGGQKRCRVPWNLSFTSILLSLLVIVMCGCWEPNIGLREGPQVLLTAELSLQPYLCNFKELFWSTLHKQRIDRYYIDLHSIYPENAFIAMLFDRHSSWELYFHFYCHQCKKNVLYLRSEILANSTTAHFHAESRILMLCAYC